MFRNNTVFVIGAGASWHYGYPTGEGLIDAVTSMARRFQAYCVNRVTSGQVVQIIPDYVVQRTDPSKGIAGAMAGWTSVRDECEALITRLQTVRPLVIDYFLAWNESLRPIGNLMIAAVILECDLIWEIERANQNRRLALTAAPKKLSADELRQYNISKYQDDWYRFIVHKLVYGCAKSSDLFENRIHIITFNYDTSLEFHIRRALRSIDLFNSDDVGTFLYDGRILHVYGAVPNATEYTEIDRRSVDNLGSSFARPLNHGGEFGPRKAFLDAAFQASTSLQTVDPNEKELNDERLKQARDWIGSADVIYILGYGFDENNSRRIGLNPLLRVRDDTARSIMFTNFRDIDVINKRASRIFYDRPDQFSEMRVHRTPKEGGYIEKSTRNVYDALALDFDSLEDQLIAATRI